MMLLVVFMGVTVLNELLRSDPAASADPQGSADPAGSADPQGSAGSAGSKIELVAGQHKTDISDRPNRTYVRSSVGS